MWVKTQAGKLFNLDHLHTIVDTQGEKRSLVAGIGGSYVDTLATGDAVGAAYHAIVVGLKEGAGFVDLS